MSEQARYEVRTPMVLWLSNGAITAVSVLVIGALLMFANVPGFLLVLVSVLGATTLAFWASMSAYRVGGGRNLIRFHADRVEVPDTSRRQPLMFPREGVEITISDVLVAYRLGIAAVGNVQRGKLIVLRHGTVARTISTLILAHESEEAALVADFQRFLAREPALGHAGHSALVAQRTTYDDRLDRELAQLD